jgi:hypothetical protein
VNVETKDQSKQWMHIRSPNKPKEFKQTLSARKLMVTVFGQERSADGGIRATRNQNNVKRVLRNTKNNV